MFNKGDIVTFTHYTVVHRFGYERKIYSYEYKEPMQGIIIGFSFLRTGKVTPSRGDWDNLEPAYLSRPIDNKVWLIEPFTHGNRYVKPVRVLEQHIKLWTKSPYQQYMRLNK